MIFNLPTSISVLILLLWNTVSAALEDPVKDQGNGSTKDNLLNVLETESYAFTPSLRKAFLDHARQEASLRLKEKDTKSFSRKPNV